MLADTPAKNQHFLNGSGELATLMRKTDWSTHALGDPSTWPVELKVSISLMLNSQFPMFISWGSERTFFYNDAYAPILGAKHPRALGGKFENVWSDIWKDLVPIVKKVEDGIASYFEDLPLYMNRNGAFEQTYFTFSYSPIKDDAGSVVGLFCACVETTAKIEATKSTEKAQNDLAESRERYKDLFDYSPLPKLVFDPETLQILEVNETAVQQYGYSRDEFLSMKVSDIRPPDDLESFHKSLKEENNTGAGQWKRNSRHVKKDRSVIDVEVSALEITFNGKRARLAAMNDVTEKARNEEIKNRLLREAEAARRDAETNLENLRSFFMQSPFPMVILEGKEFRFTLANPPYEKLVARKVLGKTALEAFSKEEIGTFVPLLEGVYNTGVPFIGKEMPLTIPDEHGKEKRLWVDIGYHPFRNADGTMKGVLAIVQDITEHVEAREKILLAKQEAEAARIEAERANELKSAFLANMSHEIRTPLGAMMGFADLLKEPGLTASERQSFTDILSRNGESLSVIINDILDLSKVEAGHLTLEYTDTYPDQIGADVVSLLRVKARDKALVLNYTHDETSPASIVADPMRVRQILINLVSNAIKFTQFGSVNLRSFACKTERGRDALCFEIADTGIGIPESQQEKIFEMFVQADGSMTRRFGGTGLGLALSRRLAREMGGDVVITESKEGVGSKFLVTIEDQPECRNEVVQARSKTSNSPELSEKELQGLKILVVDDAPDNQQLIWRYLTKYGAVIESAENGLVGYRQAIGGNFDLVLMDIQMPIMDGYSATQKLREAGYRKPIVALTAHAMNEVRKKALNVGYTDHLTKPINPKELVSTIARLTKRASH